METKTNEREILSPDELAEYLGCGRTYVYTLLREGAIKSFKVGRLRRVRRFDVEQYIEERAKASSRKR